MGGGGIVSSSAKRKKVSPTGETIIKRALKLRKGNSPNSPVLRSRKVIERKKMTQKKTPPKNEEMNKKDLGGPKKKIVKTQRQSLTPRRIWNEGKGQKLITSIFSPRVKERDENELSREDDQMGRENERDEEEQ